MKHCIDCGTKKSKKGVYCKSCSYNHRTRPSGLKYNIVKDNSSWFKKGHKPWNADKPSHLIKENPGYDALHEWVERWADDPKQCQECGSTDNIEWSNKSGSYLRELSDWQRLCKKCHNRYDYDNFGARKVFYEGGRPR